MDEKKSETLKVDFEDVGQFWIPDLFISNMRTISNTGFLDHSGVEAEVDVKKNIFYSRYAQVRIN